MVCEADAFLSLTMPFFLCFSAPEFNAISHVGIPLPNTSVSPLYLRERVRVRAVWSWRVSCKSPVNRHKTSARGHRSGAVSGKRFSQKARAAQESCVQPGDEQEGRR
jgi:hypothetical protein